MSYASILEFKTYKKQAIRAAKELCYGPEVIDKLKQASDNLEVTRILKDARIGE